MRVNIRQRGGLGEAIKIIEMNWVQGYNLVYKADLNGQEISAIKITHRKDGSFIARSMPGRGNDAILGIWANLRQAIEESLERRFDGTPGWYERIRTGRIHQVHYGGLN